MELLYESKYYIIQPHDNNIIILLFQFWWKENHQIFLANCVLECMNDEWMNQWEFDFFADQPLHADNYLFFE